MIKNALDIAFENMENTGKKLEKWKNYWNVVNTRIYEAKRIILESPGKCWKILENSSKITEKKLENWKNYLKMV